MNRDPRLIIFARALRAGQVKTRLIPAYGEQGALALYRQLLQRTVDAALAFPGSVTLCVDSDDAELRALADRLGWDYGLQQGRDLGERMAYALSAALAETDQVLLVGSDCPVLERTTFETALKAFDRNKVVFVASEDGGYVLLGSCAAELWRANPFNGVRWGTQWALADSCRQFADDQYETLDCLWDVDTPDDVQRAMASGILTEIAERSD